MKAVDGYIISDESAMLYIICGNKIIITVLNGIYTVHSLNSAILFLRTSNLYLNQNTKLSYVRLESEHKAKLH